MHINQPMPKYMAEIIPDYYSYLSSNEYFDLFGLSALLPFLAGRDPFLAPEDEAEAALPPFPFLLVLPFIVSSRPSKCRMKCDRSTCCCSSFMLRRFTLHKNPGDCAIVYDSRRSFHIVDEISGEISRGVVMQRSVGLTEQSTGECQCHCNRIIQTLCTLSWSLCTLG